MVDLIARREPEVVFHLAAQADVRVSVARPAFDAEINIIGSLNVLEGARQGGARKIVFASSGGTIYGEPDPPPPGEGVAPAAPAVALRRGQEGGRRLPPRLPRAARPRVHVAGAGQRLRPPPGPARRGRRGRHLRRALLDGKPCTIFGDGEQTRDFVYVDDVVDAFVRAADRGSGLLCNIGTGVETSVNELYATMAAAAGVDRAARPGPGPAGELARSALDPGRAKIHLGWEPWTDLRTGVTEVLAWFRGWTNDLGATSGKGACNCKHLLRMLPSMRSTAAIAELDGLLLELGELRARLDRPGPVPTRTRSGSSRSAFRHLGVRAQARADLLRRQIERLNEQRRASESSGRGPRRAGGRSRRAPRRGRATPGRRRARWRRRCRWPCP